MSEVTSHKAAVILAVDGRILWRRGEKKTLQKLEWKNKNFWQIFLPTAEKKKKDTPVCVYSTKIKRAMKDDKRLQ